MRVLSSSTVSIAITRSLGRHDWEHGRLAIVSRNWDTSAFRPQFRLLVACWSPVIDLDQP